MLHKCKKFKFSITEDKSVSLCFYIACYILSTIISITVTGPLE